MFQGSLNQRFLFGSLGKHITKCGLKQNKEHVPNLNQVACIGLPEARVRWQQSESIHHFTIGGQSIKVYQFKVVKSELNAHAKREQAQAR